MKTITNYTLCQCGAVTLNFEDGEVNSIKKSNLKKFGISLIGAKKDKNVFYQCNHCVNHYGLDICECGSGEKPEKCCKKGTREKLGESVKFMGWV